MALDQAAFRGIFVIVVTPFDETGALDEAALERTLEFCFTAGVAGVVATANASEAGYLTEAERKRVAEVVVAGASGRAAAIVGVSAAHARISAEFAVHAEKAGADAIMAMPPTFHPPTRAEIIAFYRALGGACSLPLVLQNAIGPGATPMPAEFLVEIAHAVPTARFVKEETHYPAQLTADILRLGGDRILGVMGGRAGRTLMEEARVGICGTMPACEFADVHVALWNAIDAGDETLSRTIFRHLLPLIDFETSYGIPLCKEVLKARGVIPTATWRQTGLRPLDATALAEMDTLLAGVADFMHPDLRCSPRPTAGRPARTGR